MSPPGLTIASLSDVGRVRSRNEDACGTFARDDGFQLLVIADGMGGHRAGATASRVTVDTIGEIFAESADAPADMLRRAIETANERVHAMAAAEAELRGMGTTAIALLLRPDGEGWVAHVGDSRLYRSREGGLRLLTRDHSVVAELERRGLLTPEEAAVHPRRNEIMRSVGVSSEVEVEVQELEVLSGDRYLLCSDGLSGMVDEIEIAEIIDGAAPEEAARQLVDRANEHGGHDNVTVQIARVDPDAHDAVEPAAATAAATTTRPPAARAQRHQQRRALMALVALLAGLAVLMLLWRVYEITRPPPAPAAALDAADAPG